MDTFHTLIFETYTQFNIFLKEYVKLNKQIYNDNNNDKIDFYEISNLLINNIISRTTATTNNTLSTSTKTTNNYDTQLFNLFELSDLNEFLICLLFASGNQELAIRIIKENSGFIGQQFLNGQINHGIPFAIAFSNRLVLDVLSEQCSIPPVTLINGNRGLIMTASLYGNLSTIEYLIEVLANGGGGDSGSGNTSIVGCLGYKNTNGDTPLHFAAMNGDTNIIDVLVNTYQEDLLACNSNGFNVLTCSTFHNQYECIQWLCQTIEKKYGKKMKKQILEHKNKDGETCLLIATRLGFDKSVRVLIDHGCEINTLNKKLKSPFDYLKLVLSNNSNNNNNNNDNNNNNNNTILESFSDQQLQIKLNSLKSTLPQLQYINQQLLPATFKDQVLFSHPNFKNITRSIKSFKTIEQLFKIEADKKEKEIEKNLKELLSTEKKLNLNNNVGNNKNKQSQKKQQSQQQKPQQQKTTTEMINQKSSTTGNNTANSIKNEETINNNLKDINNEKETLSTKPTEKVHGNIVKQKETISKTTNVITTSTPIQPQSQPQQSQPQQSQPQQTQLQTEPPQQSNSSKNRNNNLQKSYREEYSELANIYLEQSIKYKEMVMRLGEIENYFSKFNESLYSKNKKAEALGLGVAEILGLGLEYLSSSQLNVLEGIHKDAINEIQNFKNIQK